MHYGNGLTLILVAVVLTAFVPAPAPTNLTLANAIHTGKVKVQVDADGTIGETFVELQIASQTKKTLKVEIPEGTMFVPGDAGEQTLIATNGRILELKGEATRTFQLPAFCTELGDRYPSDQSTFTIAQNENPKLQKLVDYLGRKRITDHNVIQQSVWCITDGSSVSSINEEGGPGHLTEFITELTGQTKPWYQVERRPYMTPERRIVNTAATVRGEILFDNQQPIVLEARIVNAEGETVYEAEKDVNLPAGKLSYTFKLEVTGWDEGSYTIKYTTGDTEHHSQEFTI